MPKKQTKKQAKKGAKKTPTAVQRAVDLVKDLSNYDGVMLMSDNSIGNVVTLPSGILSLDLVMGGGYPCGRIIEIYGKPGGGKTTTTLQAIASAQKFGSVCAFVDVEHSLDKEYAKALGVDFSTLIFHQPDAGEEALNLVGDLASRMQQGDLIVVDSVAALTPQAELDGDIGDSHMGLHARLMSQAMRKLNGQAAKSGAIVIFINQIRMKIGVTWGSPETTTGGEALKFYTSVRIDVRKTGPVKKGSDIIGHGVRFKVVKNKVYPPYKEAETGIRFGKGVPRAIDILTIAKLVNLLNKDGSWLYYQDKILGQGIENAAESLEQNNPELLDEMEKRILEIYELKRIFKRK